MALERLTLIQAGAIAGFVNPIAGDRPDLRRIDSMMEPLRDGAVVIGQRRWIHENGREGGVNQLRAVGPATEVVKTWGSSVERILDYPGSLLMPGFVNAHTHLELTSAGRWPLPGGGEGRGGLIDWVKQLRGLTGAWTDADRAESHAEGVRQSAMAGTAAVGDIVSEPGRAKGQGSGEGKGAGGGGGVGGVLYWECFGLGPPWDEDATGLGEAIGRRSEGRSRRPNRRCR